MENKVIAYIDLLGLSNNAREDIEGALMMYQSYNTILSTKIRDKTINPTESYPKELQELVKNITIDSFEHFIPFSDSIFVTSSDVNLFVTQLSSFLYGCFDITSRFYMHPKDPSDPTKGKMVSFDYNDKGELIPGHKYTHYYPAIFRGGISYGEVILVELYSIIGSQPTKRESLTGKAVVTAVGLESKVKGPRIIIDEKLVKMMDEKVRRMYVRKVPRMDLYEILWPAIMYIHNNGPNDLQHFNEMFRSAINLWKGYNHTAYGIHYFNLMELIVASTLQYFDAIGCRDEAMKIVEKAIDTQGLKDKKSSLILNL
jgi:hypothetical protein